MNDQVVGAVPEEEEEKTPYELFLEMLQAKKDAYDAQPDNAKNAWDRLAIEQLEEWGRTHYDEMGDQLPTEPVAPDVKFQFSPPEVLAAEGYQTFVPRGFGKVPWWVANRVADPSVGLEVSISRSAGCFLVRNQAETAQLWVNNAAEVAAQYGTTPRLIAMAGNNMLDYRYMVPTFNWGGVYGYNGFAPEPEVPFNAEERRVNEENWRKFHMRPGMLGVNFMTTDIFFKTADKTSKVDPNGKHRIFLVSNHPEFVIPGMMAYFNTAWFKTNAYNVAKHLAHEIDAQMKAPVAGYEPVTITGSDKTAWYAANGEGPVVPRFNPGLTQ